MVANDLWVTFPTELPPKLIGIGVDIGTTFFGACVYYRTDAGHLSRDSVFVPGQQKESKFPSVVFVPDDRNAPELVGETAINADAHMAPGKIFSRFKLKLGTTWNEEYKGRRISAKSLTTSVLKEIKTGIDLYLSERNLSQIPKRYCFTHPGTWNEVTLREFRSAIQDAGFPEFTTITEPVATALAVARFSGHPEIASKEQGQKHHTLICDFGGGTFDIALVDVTDTGWIRMKSAADGNPYLGMSNLDLIIGMMLLKAHGKLNRNGSSLLDQRIVEEPRLSEVWVEQGLKREWRYSLEGICAELKKTIGNTWERNETFLAALPDGNPGIIKKNELLPLIVAMRASATATIIRFAEELAQHGIGLKEIDYIVIGGGGSKLPGITEAINATLPHARALDVDQGIVTNLVQYGAAVAAADPLAVKEPRLNSSYGVKTYLESVPHWHAYDVRIGHKPDIENVEHQGVTKPHYAHYRKILVKGDILEREKTMSFPVLHPGRSAITFKVLQGESVNPRENTLLGEVICPLHQGVEKGHYVECTFRLNKDGLIEVLARDPTIDRSSNVFTFMPDYSAD